ncbi:glycine--tRNA ligase [Candidatus Micrarchaeota archaeon]|nr:MAG: glycine--tRNA ligase [Candidatus Micrarchaeota archaeon]
MQDKSRYDKIMEICLKRGIFYPSSEIYGAFAGFYDYGSIGSRIKRRLENYWRSYFLKIEENIHEIQPSEIMPEKVWKASGHLQHFTDPVVVCKKCKMRYRADELLESILNESFEGLSEKEMDGIIKKHKIKCLKCGGELSNTAHINLMFSFEVGFNSGVKAFLRPETAQGSYVNFKREYKVNRERIPLGLAIVGKAFRNEISPRQGLFRMREFTQAELQIFIRPEDIKEHPDFDSIRNLEMPVVLAEKRKEGIKKMKASELVAMGYGKRYVYYMAKILEFFQGLGIEKMRFWEKNEEEKAFYNKYHFDLEVWFNSYSEYKEVAACHYRTDYDLSRHQKYSGEKMEINKGGVKFIPHVVELTFGIDRMLFLLLDSFYREEEKRKYFALPKQVAPYIAAVYPLVNKNGIDEKALEIYEALKKDTELFYDSSGSIGRRYARADEIGIPFGITIDYDTLKDNTVTIRDRDSTKQKRVRIEKLKEALI